MTLRPTFFPVLLPIFTIEKMPWNLSPNYQRPDLPVPATWPTHTPNPKGGEDKINVQDWQAVYPDPTLQSLIQTALKNNRDLRVATLNIENARALYRVQRAATLPNFSLVAEDKISDAKQGANLQEYGMGISLLSYELDFFGKVANLKEDALYRFLATEAAQKNVQTALMADVQTLLDSSRKSKYGRLV